MTFQPEEPSPVVDSGTIGRSSSGGGGGGGMGDMMSEMQKKLAARRAKAENTGQVRTRLCVLCTYMCMTEGWKLEGMGEGGWMREEWKLCWKLSRIVSDLCEFFVITPLESSP